MKRPPQLFFAFALTLVAGPAAAQTDLCTALSGTYLTTKIDTSGVDTGAKGRTILTLAPGGVAMMNDSAQYGIEGYQAFGDMQGAWRCEGADGFHATLLDFTYPDAANPDAQVARVEVSGTLDDSSKLKGQTEVHLYPLFDDPLSDATPELTVGYAFEGQKLILPPS
ncbi:MAG: hypothetical protein AAGC86_08525 [Pseudomonadota bacterium]